jgi:hypothetical protein
MPGSSQDLVRLGDFQLLTRQVLAVDGDLELFSRAWCVAEVAEAYMMGTLIS